MHDDSALCGGSLIWYRVPAAGALLRASGLIECCGCGYWLIAGTIPNARHLDSPVILMDEPEHGYPDARG